MAIPEKNRNKGADIKIDMVPICVYFLVPIKFADCGFLFFYVSKVTNINYFKRESPQRKFQSAS